MMAGMSNLPAVARRLTRALPAISPRTRARVLAGLLAFHLALVLMYLLYRIGWGWLLPVDWFRHLDAGHELGTADRYSGVLFCVVAALAAAQALRPPSPRSGPRWLWVIGWLSAGFLIALVAIEELHWRVDAKSIVGPALGLMELPDQFRWMLVAAPVAVLLAALSGWVLWAAVRGHPARALLVALVAALSLGSLIQDAIDDMLIYPLLVNWLGFPQVPVGVPGGLPVGLPLAFEEGAEVLAAAALGAMFLEMLAARPDALPIAPGSRRRQLAALGVAVGLLAIITVPLLTHRLHKGDGWETVAPWSYTGPLTAVEQRFRARQDNFRRIDVWAYVHGGPPGAPAEIFARLTPEGSERPIRESRAQVDGARYRNDTVSFDFVPIPDSSGKVYHLTVGVLSGPKPFVYLGLTSGDAIPEGPALVSGSATPFADDLAMRTAWTGRFIDGLYPQDPRYWGLIGEVILHIFLWVLLVVVTWSGLSGRRPRFWQRFVWPSVLTSALVTACILGVTLAVLAVRLPAQLA